MSGNSKSCDNTLLVDSFEKFCGEPLLNYSTVLVGNSPNFPGCFQHTVLIWVPCIFAWLSAIYIFYANHKRVGNTLPWTVLNILKFIICALICIIWIIILVLPLVKSSCVYAVDYVSPSFMIFTFIIELVIFYYLKKKSVVSSAFVFLSWLLFVVCGIVEFGVNVSTFFEGQEVKWEAICFVCYFILATVELVLLSFADKREKDFVKETNACPREYASFLNRLVYFWFWKTAILGWRRALTRSDLWNLSDDNKSSELVKEYEHYWLKSKQKHHHYNQNIVGSAQYDSLNKADSKTDAASTYVSNVDSCPSIPWTLFLCFRGLLIPATITNFLQVCLQFVSPQILNVLLNFIQDPTQPLWFGITISVFMFACACVQSLLQQQSMSRMFVFGMRLKTVLTATIYKKALRLSNSSRRQSTVGEIINHMAVDVQRFIDVAPWIQMLWSTPLQIILALFFLYQIISWAAFVGFAIMLILIPVNFQMSRIQRNNQVIQMKWKDDRIKLMSEILNGIKVLKLYAWETPFEKKVMQIRAKELEVLRKAAVVIAVNAFTLYCAPFLVAVVSFAAYTLAIDPEHELSPQVAFVSLSLFNILRGPLNGLPSVISMIIQASVSNNRLRKFLSLEEIDDLNVEKGSISDETIAINNGSFKWDKNSDKINLDKINLSIKRGQLVAIVGQVGVGKSSLLSAMLGEMEKIKGYVSLNGSVAYVPQQAWIRNTTLHQNVTFTREMDADLYKKVVNACALEDDLAILPNGDETEIGEKGINLSGGQKQRVSLARAVYQNRDIYLLDDPLSAVDAHVGRHIFDNVISNRGMLKNKTRVLVTHGLTYLKYMDNIIVLKDGKVNESGTFVELVKSAGAFAEFLDTYLLQLENNPTANEEDANELFNDPELAEAAKILQARRKSSASKYGSARPSVEQQMSEKSEKEIAANTKKEIAIDAGAKLKSGARDEKVAVGKVTWKVYKTYGHAVGYFSCFAVFFCFFASGAFGIGTNLWLAAWSNDNVTSTDSVNLDVRLGVYFALGITQGIFIFLASILNAYATVSASSMLHKSILHNLLRVPMSFFDVTPMGAVINRVGKDVDIMDNTVPSCIRQWIMAMLSVVSSIVLILISTPIFATVIIPMGIFYYLVQVFYVSTARQLKRLESASRSPIFSFFGETLQGISSIRAYEVNDWFTNECDRRIDYNQMAYYPTIVSTRWLAVYLQFAGNCLILFAALFAVLTRNWDSVNAGLVGLSVTYALTMTQALLMGVRTSSDLETNIVAIERIKEYADIPIEAEWVTDERPPKQWPDKGEIKFANYSLRYRSNLDLVIKGINCDISELEKVGIVGRTGAGKSSLSLALFRLVEPADGTIYIDGIDVSRIGLHDLRSKLGIIPQDPVLFSGALRSNLDPFETYSDDDLWRALEQSHLKNFVATLPDKLEHKIIEGGENLSVGQRQLICLARALLRNSKILIFDEATAAIDMETESLIQQTVKTCFSNCTMLTIAHRINTILNSDRIMVMSQGQILELDSPSNLLKDQQSSFYKMAKDAGLI